MPLWLSHKYTPKAELLGNQPSLHGWRSDLTSELQCPIRPDEIVIAAKQLEVIFKTFLPSCLTYRPPTKIRRALLDCQIQPLDKGCVQLRGILGVAQCLFKSPFHTDHLSSLNLDNTIFPAGFNDLAIQTCWPKDLPDSSFVELESICGNQREMFEIYSAGDVLKQRECISVASSPDYCGQPEPRPDFNCGEDPYRLFFAADDRSDLVCL
jgi:hypothetical protein